MDDLTNVVVKIQSEFNYLLNELESLGIRREDLCESNNIHEIENLIDNVKQTYIQNYRSYYGYDHV